MSHQIRLKQVAPLSVATRRMHTTLANIGHTMQATLGEIVTSVSPPDGAQGVPFAIYHNEPFRPDDVDVEMGLALAENATLAPSSLAERKVLPGGPVAYTMHVGDYGTIGAAYEELYTWLSEHGYRPSGPPRELYLVGPGEGVVPSEYRTEIDVPVAS
jgi:effector-binding domain-containing protein